MPEVVLGPRGYITSNQSNLRSLSLAVDGSCPGNSLDGLAQLKSLRHFHWRGIVTQRNFGLFRTVVKNNAYHLVSLGAEVMDRVRRPSWQIDLDLIWLGLLVPSKRHIERFPEAGAVKNKLRLKSLVSLSLCEVSLASWGRDDLLTFDPGRLTTLTLNRCPSTLRFFETWNSRNHGLSLQSFSGIIDERWEGRTSFPLELLLRKYGSKLEDFYIGFTNKFDVNILFELYTPLLKRMSLSFIRRRLVIPDEYNLPDRYSLRGILRLLPGIEGFAFSRSPYSLVSSYE